MGKLYDDVVVKLPVIVMYGDESEWDEEEKERCLGDDEAFGWVYDRVVNLTAAANEGAWRLAAIDGAQDIQLSTYKADERGYYNVSAAKEDSPLSPSLTGPPPLSASGTPTPR